MYGRLTALLGRGPRGMAPEHRALFRRALLARLRGDLARAERLLASLPPSPSVQALRGLLLLDARRTLAPFDRLLFDASYRPPESERADFAAGLGDEELVARVRFRNDVIDALTQDAGARAPLFPTEAVPALERITGQLRLANAAHQLRRWWSGARSLAADGQEAVWLCARLWGAGCWRAAERAARAAPDSMLLQAVRLARLIGEGPPGDGRQEWLSAHTMDLALVPAYAQAFQIHRVDSEILRSGGLSSVLEIDARRHALVEWLIGFWSRYEDELSGAPWIVAWLTGYRTRFLRHSAFVRWWQTSGPRQKESDGHMAEGLRWAGAGQWREAAAAFAAAGEGADAAYNHARSLMKLEQWTETAAVLERLVASHPADGVAWFRLGETYRALGRVEDALRAYARAAELYQDDETITHQLEVERLAAQLEAQGVSRLSSRSRVRALEALEIPGRTPGGEDDDEPGSVH
jgi:tetratricopeptide (TPR) repeat protein